jgi:hypothetical protein
MARLTRAQAQKLHDRGLLRPDNRFEVEAELAAEKFELEDVFAHAEEIRRGAIDELVQED